MKSFLFIYPPAKSLFNFGNTRHEHEKRMGSIIVINNPRAILVRLQDPVSRREVVFLRLALGVEIGTLGLAAHADCVAAVGCEAVACGMVLL